MFIYRKFTSILSLFVIIFSLMSSGFQSVPVSAQGRDGVNTATVTPTGIPVATETPIPIKTLPSAETSVQTDTSLPPELPASPEVSSSVFIPLAVTTWYVTTTGLDSNSCTTTESPCLTINGAIGKAATSGDTIKVAVGTYTGSDAEVVLINKSVTLSGGWNSIFTTQNSSSIIDGQGARRGVTVNSDTSITIERFTVQNGSTSISPGGGGILNDGSLILNNIIITGNDASFGGGGVLNNSTLTLNESTVNGNTHSGLYNNGNLTMINSTISNNIDGGIWNSGYLALNNSTVSNNSLSYYSGEGGGILNGGTVILNNSTVSGNTAAGGRGGGIANNGNATINNSTITGNNTAEGGGISNLYGIGLILRNSIVAGNTAVTGPDCYDNSDYAGSITSAGYNLIGNTTNCAYIPGTGDLINVNARLAPLDDNGGSTYTHATYNNSPAINAGNPATPGSDGNACLATDQRGVVRPVSTRCDIGAYEGGDGSGGIVNFATLIKDPSFEASYGNITYWGQYSTNFGSPLCTISCGGGGTAGPRTGAIWAWFGGTPANETASLSQTITIPNSIPDLKLQFYFWIGSAAAGSDAADIFTAKIDGTTIFSANATQIASYSTYKLVSVDVSSFANGAPHTLVFSSVTTGQIVNFNLDDVSLIGRWAVSGNTGVAGVTLSYIDGTAQAATSKANGSYSFLVSDNWSGTVTPSHPCFTFIPTSRPYSNVTANVTAQNYTATFVPTSGCANINVDIGGVIRGIYGLPAQGSLRQNYAGVDSGPVKVVSTGGNPIISAIRSAWAVNGVTTSFSQLMGLPLEQLSDTYVFPGYNNVTLNDQLRIANVDTVPTTVTVTIGGNLKGTYPLAAGAAVRINYPGLDSGPVVVQGTSGVKIISSIREAWAVNGVTKSFVQLMGLPAGQLSNKYVFPAYNNVTLNEQLRIGNVDTVATSVTVTIGGTLRGTYPLGPGQAVRINYPGLDSGPVVVEGTAGVNIISSIRSAWAVNGVTTSFSQLMGMPAEQISDKYLFPAYNNVTLNDQLRIANVDTVPTTVTVTIGGNLKGTYPLAAGGAVRINYPGLDSGPVVVQGTSGVKIISSIREAWAVNGVTQSFVQLMGLPAGQLSTTYLFPAYNNVTLNEQLRIGVP